MKPCEKPFGVAVVGCGTVGGATAKLLGEDADLLAARCGRAIELRHIVDVDFSHARELGLDEALFKSDLAEALDDDATDCVIELVGGTGFAREVVERALDGGKQVVTANKALLAEAGPDLFARARENGAAMAFEASCAGGIPVVGALCGGLLANRIDALYGIVNGTCNYILSEMARRGIGYDQALQEAQRDGLAEADPTLDVGGGDSAHKLAILSSLAFAQRVELGQIPVAGIDALQARDVAYGQELGYVIKLLAIAQRLDEGLALRVRPVFIHREHPLAWVSGPFNAVSVYGHAVGHTMYYGRGAGGQPTASAVVSDVAALAVGSAQRSFECLGLWPDRSESARQLPAEQIRSRYYLRVMVEDHPGVLAKIAAILGRHDISIASVLQHESGEAGGGDTAAVVITTARAVEGDLRNALSEIAVLEESRDEPVMIGIVDEHEEAL